jgi:two-component system, OmpR family, response regulator
MTLDTASRLESVAAMTSCPPSPPIPVAQNCAIDKAGSKPQRQEEGRRGEAILVVEDDPDIAAVVQLHLEDAGYSVTIASDGGSGLDALAREKFDLIVLDIMLPGISGLDICRRVAREEDRPMILILSSRSAEVDRVLGLQEGADDYLTKPFSVLELVARVRALFRRPPPRSDSWQHGDSQRVTAGALSVDRRERCAWYHGMKIDLTTREFDLLLWFARNPGRVYTRAELLDGVWGKGYDGFEHTVNSHLNRLRAKLESDPARPKLLITVRGAGYKLSVPD